MGPIKIFLYIFIFIAIIAAVSFVYYYHAYYCFFEDKSKDTLIIESAKALLQLAGVAALGGLFKFLYDEATEERRKQDAANDIRKGLLNDLIDARSNIEEARRNYLMEIPLQDSYDKYKETILKILEARLKLARIWNDIKTSGYLFSNHACILNKIGKMKDYLEGLINEYENALKEFSETKKPEDELKKREKFSEFINEFTERKKTEDNKAGTLKEFISKDLTSKYIKNFLDVAYRPAVEEMRKEVFRARKLNPDEKYVDSDKKCKDSDKNKADESQNNKSNITNI